jgi:hypothetical protein
MSATTLQSPGPLLARLLAAQQVEERAVSYAELERSADQLIARARDITECLVWPVGAAAERVAAAVTLRSRGDIEVGVWNTEVKGRRVLLFVVAGVSSLALEAAAAQLRRRGACEVHGCGVAVDGAKSLGVLKSYVQVDIDLNSRSAVALVGDAA